MTIVEFLLARIAEDEAVASEVLVKTGERPWLAPRYYEDAAGSSPTAYFDMDYNQGGFVVSASRVLAECAAKRRIVARHAPGEFADAPGEYFCTLTPTWGFWPCADLLDLAQAYSSHPDFDLAWGTTQV